MRLYVIQRLLITVAFNFFSMATLASDAQTEPVNAYNFVRAETDMYFKKTVDQGGFGTLLHSRELTPLDKQTVVRMNRDTLYSAGVFDLDAGPVSITLPPNDKRFMSMQVISQDHYTNHLTYNSGRHFYDRTKIATRYMLVIVRLQVNADQPEDLAAAHSLQDAIRVVQRNKGTYETVNWDPETQSTARKALETLASLGGGANFFGSREQVDPISHLIGTAVGWGGNPDYAAKYVNVAPDKNDGKTAYTLTLKDVPVSGFWSVSVYNRDGFFEQNPMGIYSLNNLSAKPDAKGTYTLQLGGCEATTLNCIPTTEGWSYVVRLYRPSLKVLKGRWTVPPAEPVS